MNKLIKTTFLGWILLVHSFIVLAENENPIEVFTDVNKVTVYQNSANIVRNTTVNLKKGINTIHFKKLSSHLNTSTIQFNAKGVKVLSINHDTDQYPISENKAFMDIVHQRRDLNNQIRDKELSIEILNKDLEILEANKTIKYESLNTTELKNTLAFFHDKRVQVESDKKKYHKEIGELKKQLEKVNKKLKEVATKHKEFFKEVIVTVEAPQEKTLNCQLKYLVYGVSWFPTYDILAKDLNAPVEIIFKANVIQNTDVDWKNVNLNIASGNPSRQNILPTLDPNYLNLQEEQEFTTYQNQKRAAMTYQEDSWGSSDDDSWSDEVEEETEGEIFEVLDAYEYSGYNLESTQNQTQFTYEIPVKYSITSGSQAKEIALKNEKIASEYSYRVIPKINNSVFLVGSISNWGTYNFISGKANVYFEDQYVGNTVIESSNASDTLDISLGIDESIVVKRSRDYQMERKKSLSSKKRESRAWKIEIKNNKKAPISIEVIDQVPISINEEIIVTPLELSKGKFNKKDGEVSWQLELPANTSQSLLLKYEVEYPTKGYEKLIIE